MLNQIARTHTPAAQYVARYSHPGESYLWDELAAAAWLDPSLITSEKKVYMDVNLDRGAGYGDTLVWSARVKPPLDLGLVRAQIDVNMPQFAQTLVRLITAPTPNAHHPLMLIRH